MVQDHTHLVSLGAGILDRWEYQLGNELGDGFRTRVIIEHSGRILGGRDAAPLQAVQVGG